MAIEAVRLSRGMCFGACPVYEVTFHRNGGAEWTGQYYTDLVGRFVGSIAADEFGKLARYIQSRKFFEWNDRYDTMITDVAEYRIEVVKDGVVKEVLQCGTDEPVGFERLAGRIDAVAAKVIWAPVRNALPQTDSSNLA